MKANNKDIKVFAVSGGDPTQFWAQGRMKGFHDSITAAIPDAKFVTTEENGLNVSYDPGQTYDVLPDVPVRQPGRAVHRERRHRRRARQPRHREPEQGRARSSRSAGTCPKASSTASRRACRWRPLDQRWSDQAAFGGPACAQFLKNGVILPNTQTLMPVMADQVDAQRKELDRILGQQ